MRQSVRSQGSVTASPGQKGHHALEPKVIHGDFQVWVGYLRRPPPAQTGWDIPTWSVPATLGFIFIWWWVFAAGYLLHVKNCRRELFLTKVLPQTPAQQASTDEDSRRQYIQDFMNKYYPPEDDEDEDDE